MKESDHEGATKPSQLSDSHIDQLCMMSRERGKTANRVEDRLISANQRTEAYHQCLIKW